MDDLKVNHWYLIMSNIPIKVEGKKIVARYLGTGAWESLNVELYHHTCDGKGRLGYCMWSSSAKIIREVQEKELFLWRI